MIKIVEIISINNESEYLKLNLKKNINELKKEINDITGINVKEQLWFINEDIIQSDYINAKENDQVYIVVDNKWYSLYVKILNKKIIKLPAVSSDIQINNLKNIISEKIKINPKYYNILFNSNILEDHKNISHYNVNNNSRLDLVLKIKSGFV